MEAYRDQYATLFNNGRNVTVIGISVDPDTALASWARDEDFPVVFASDPGGTVGKSYGAYDAKNKLDNRSLFVIRPDRKSTRLNSSHVEISYAVFCLKKKKKTKEIKRVK